MTPSSATSTDTMFLHAPTTRSRELSQLLRCAGAINSGFGGLQYDLNSTWQALSDGQYRNGHLCDHNCTIQVNGVATGGNYVCPASLSLNHGVSRKRLAPADVILASVATLEKGVDRARANFFRDRFASYCERFQIPADAALAVRDALDRPGLEINLFGGNPEMHPEVAVIIRELRASGHRVHLTTTGRRLMREPRFVDDVCEAGPSLIALSADDFDDAGQIHRLAQLSREELVNEWKTVRWQHGQRQKAYEAISVAKLAAEHADFPPLLFNMVLHPGNLARAESIIAALEAHFPGVLVNPYPAQSAFLYDEPALGREQAEPLREFIDRMLRTQIAAIQTGHPPRPLVARVHYWLMLRAVFDWAEDDLDRAMRMIVGEGIWRCYQDSAAGRYLQIGMGRPHQARTAEQQHPGGYLGCFWNNETVTQGGRQVWELRPAAVTKYVETGKQLLAAKSAHACPGCAFPRLAYDMPATETGMSADILPFYLKRRADAFGF